MILDKIGQEIKPGCIIAYGHALGRCAGLRIGKVLKVQHIPILAPSSYWNHVEYKITVWAINDDWTPYQLLSRKSTLNFPNRMVVLQDHLIKPEFKALLDTI